MLCEKECYICNMEEIATRLIKFIKYLEINNSMFADEIDVQRSSISHILSGRNKPSLEFLHKLFRTYPKLNSDWLIMDRGDMLIDSAIQNQISSEENISQRPEIKPDKQRSLLFPEPTPIQEQIKQEKAAKAVKKVIILYDDDTFHEYSADDS